MLKLFSKIKKKLKERGFTLVELLAVIVILAIILIITIPAILGYLQTARKKTLVTYADKVSIKASEKLLKDRFEGKTTEEGNYIYNLDKDLEQRNNTFKGYVLVNITKEDVNYIITIWTSDYMLISYNYTKGINNKGESKSISNSIEVYDESRIEELKPASLCNSTSGECIYESADSDPYFSDSSKTIEGEPEKEEIEEPTTEKNEEEPIIPEEPVKQKGDTVIIDGPQFKSKATSLANGSLSKIVYIKKSDTLKQEFKPIIISKENDELDITPVYMWFDTNTLYFYSEASIIYLSENSKEMFSYMNRLVDANDFLRNVSTSKVVNLAAMFNGCTSLASVDVSKFDTSNVTDVNGMFNSCSSLKTLNLSNFNTSKVINMSHFFNGCSSLTSINLSGFNTSNVNETSAMFGTCRSLTTIDLTSFNTVSVTDMRSMFYNCSNLTSIYVSSGWNVSNVTRSTSMFQYSYKLPNYNYINFDVSMAKDVSQGGYLKRV